MENEKVLATLKDLRQSIDNIDSALVALLAERFHCTNKVGVLKAHYQLPATDAQREETQLSRLQNLAAQHDLDPQFCADFFRFIVDKVVEHHKHIAHTLQTENH